MYLEEEECIKEKSGVIRRDEVITDKLHKVHCRL
jgi:hypothetical protein